MFEWKDVAGDQFFHTLAIDHRSGKKGKDMQSILKIPAIGLAFAALAAVPLAHADAKPAAPPAVAGDELSLADLLDIKLSTGSFLELDMSKSPISLTMIQRDKIRNAGSRNITELLETYVPGFQYSINKWNGYNWGMRGVMNDRNSKFIVLVNGHKMNTEARDGFIQELSLPGMDEVDHVEVLRGPAGLVYGSGAIAGIVNVVTRKGDENTAGVSGQLGSWGSLSNTERTFQGGFYKAPKDNLKYTMYASYSESEGQGQNKTKIYGADGWPYPAWEWNHDISNGLISNGSANSTPGSWKIGGTIDAGEFSLQARLTHQATNVGGWMLADLWPQTQKMDSMAFTTPANVWAWQDGRPLNSKTDNPYTSVDLNSKQAKSRAYVVDNIMAEGNWSHPFGQDVIKVKAAFDGNTNRTQVGNELGLEVNNQPGLMPGYIMETFGEKRYTLGGTYLLKRIPDLQLAAGYEFRLDDLGNDLEGQNFESFYGNATTNHYVITPTTYTNNALFVEGMYDVNSKLSLGFGGRWDGATRTYDDAGTFNGKLSAVYIPKQGHSIKAIVQTSSQNPTVDNYEPNRYYYDDFGKLYDYSFFQTGSLMRPGGTWVTIYYPTTPDKMHSLKPERTVSYELTSTHQFPLQGGKSVSFSPSVSYNTVQNLLAWDENVYLVRNTSDYQFVDMEFEAEFKSKTVDVGVNHAWQAPVSLDVKSLGQNMKSPSVDPAAAGWLDSNLVNGVYQYRPNPKAITTSSYYYNSVQSTVSRDGNNFLNLSPNLTKIYVDVRPAGFLSLHADAKIYWGYTGMSSLQDTLNTLGSKFDFLGISDNAMVKMNAGVGLNMPDQWTAHLYAYNLLAGESDSWTKRNQARVQNVYGFTTTNLYMVDNLELALKIEKTF